MDELIPVFNDHSYPSLDRMLRDQALGCPQCGGHSRLTLLSTLRMIPRFAIACGECNHRGPLGKSIDDAIKRWNKPPGLLGFLFSRRVSP
jgi:hypothetical protein